MEKKIKKLAILILGAFIAAVPAVGQQTEFNDPQIISIVETINQMEINYAKIAYERAANKRVKEFAHQMADRYSRLFEQTSALETKLILATQTNALTRALLRSESEVIRSLKDRKQEYISVIYLDNAVSAQKEAIFTLKTMLIPQARHAVLKDFLNDILPVWEQLLEATKKMQTEMNK